MSKQVVGVGPYVNRIPPEVRRAIDGLSNDVRQAIVVALSEEGRLRFSALQSMLGISKPDLAFHLSRLVQAGLVLHVYERFPSEESYAYYRLSELGESLLLGIEGVFSPPVTPKPIPTQIKFLEFGLKLDEFKNLRLQHWLTSIFTREIHLQAERGMEETYSAPFSSEKGKEEMIIVPSWLEGGRT